MELRDAMTQISEIRLQMARTEVFRGYRAAPVAVSGLLAFLAAGAQTLWISDPLDQLNAYVALWVGAAVLSALAAGAGMAISGRQATHSAWRRRITWLAIEQFVPCLVAGGCVTAVLLTVAPGTCWILPGLWQVLFSLGVFASYRLLPKAIFGVGVFYLAAGVTCLAVARGAHACSPLAMGLPFGAGQLLAAAILYWTLERGDGE
jgi:hypothetical protein